jgi:hypothetical protein
VSQTTAGVGEGQHGESGHGPTCVACGHPIIEGETACLDDRLRLVHGACNMIFCALVSGLLDFF